MSYKTILVQADLPDAVANGVRLAAQLANDEQAHLVGYALSGADQAIAQCNAAVAGMVALPTDLGALTEKADAARTVDAQPPAAQPQSDDAAMEPEAPADPWITEMEAEQQGGQP